MQPQQTIDLLTRQDPRGAEELLRHYGPLMKYVIAPIVTDLHDREECLFEAAFRISQKIQFYDPARGSWTAWVTSVTRNVALNKIRSEKHRPDTEPIPENLPAPDASPEALMLRKEQQKILRSAINQLVDMDQILFYRKYYYLQTTAQIALETGLSERAVEGRLYRIKKRLRALLGGDTDG